MKILVCMWYNEDIKKYADFFKNINEEYCKKNNYEFLCSDKKYTDKPPAFNKIYLLKELLEKNEYDYYVWIDADAHFCNNSKLEGYIENHIDKDFIWSGDKTPNINTGIFIMKNTDFSNTFLDKWINTKETTNEDWWEQGILTKMPSSNDLNIKEHSFVFRYGMLQSFTDKSNNLVYHMAGTSKEERIKYSKSKFEIKN
jgi:hypothetical protein